MSDIKSKLQETLDQLKAVKDQSLVVIPVPKSASDAQHLANLYVVEYATSKDAELEYTKAKARLDNVRDTVVKATSQKYFKGEVNVGGVVLKMVSPSEKVSLDYEAAEQYCRDNKLDVFKEVFDEEKFKSLVASGKISKTTLDKLTVKKPGGAPYVRVSIEK